MLSFHGLAFGDERPLRVYFVGNSYTYVNDLPGVLAALSEAGGGRRIVTGQHTPGGFTLEQHVKDGGAVDAIKNQNCDVVVLQEQSVLPVIQPTMMYDAARKLHTTIKSHGAKTVFYLTWARKVKPEMQDGLNQAYGGIAKELQAGVAPVGPAWQRAMRESSNVELYAKDGSHPGTNGTYLAACVFYAVLLEKSPVGLPAEVKKENTILLKIDPATAARLQRAAWATVQEWNRLAAIVRQ
jgi:hypothetical protein